jgi:hypothetical protein
MAWRYSLDLYLRGSARRRGSSAERELIFTAVAEWSGRGLPLGEKRASLRGQSPAAFGDTVVEGSGWQHVRKVENDVKRRMPFIFTSIGFAAPLSSKLVFGMERNGSGHVFQIVL